MIYAKQLLPLAADVGHGIFASLVAGLLTHTPLTWHFFIGIACAFLPDLDAVPRLWRTGSVMQTPSDPRDHREYLHYPFVFLVVGFGILFISTFWGVLYLTAVLFHFMNDTWGTGDGVRWLWPLSEKLLKWRRIDTWKWSGYGRTIPPGTPESWIDQVYLQVTSIALVEYSTLLVAIIALLVYFF